MQLTLTDDSGAIVDWWHFPDQLAEFLPGANKDSSACRNLADAIERALPLFESPEQADELLHPNYCEECGRVTNGGSDTHFGITLRGCNECGSIYHNRTAP